MGCFSPLYAYKGPENKETGKRSILWQGRPGSERQVIPCGKCIGCYLRYSKDWAIRCVHEASLYEKNAFVTLTFNEENFGSDRELDRRDVQLFMKRLRKKKGGGIRYFFSGEYGGKFGRPHYHGLLFNCDFDDKKLVTERMGNKIYESNELKELWPFGFSSIGDVNKKSASYVTRYCVKKAEGKVKTFLDEYTKRRVVYDEKTGQCKTAEFNLMSRGCKKLGTGGIGKAWLDKFMSDVYPYDEVVLDGLVYKPPRFYDNILEKKDEILLDSIKTNRKNSYNWEESTMGRLLAKEEFTTRKLEKFKRSLDMEESK